ncbi:hypothetical protein D8S78_19755 [Natrialba swarupiae]|nr:hypothetical protein [Natrialba swarupiae]
MIDDREVFFLVFGPDAGDGNRFLLYFSALVADIVGVVGSSVLSSTSLPLRDSQPGRRRRPRLLR